MEIKNPFQSATNTKTSDKYMPGSVEKKRAIMMHLFFGIMVSISKKDISEFEYYHLKQASGWWILFFLVLVFDLVLLILPVVKYLWIIPLLVLLVVRIINVKQAWDWKYFSNSKESVIAYFSVLWAWFIELFWMQSDLSQNANNSEVITDIETDLKNKSNQSEIEKDLEEK